MFQRLSRFAKTGMLSAMALLLVAPIASWSGSRAAAAAKPVEITYDGKKLALEVQPQWVKGRLLVPYASVVAALGGKTQWDAKTKTVTATKGSAKIVYSVGTVSATKNGEKLTLDTAPVVVGGRTFVPLRFTAESFGLWVKWNASSNQVQLFSSRTVQTKTGSLKLKARPDRIVTLSSSDTEIVAALGGHLVGRSTALGKVYPPSAASLPEVGSAHGIDFEKLASLKPDLVIGSPALQQNAATVEKLGAQMLLNSQNTFAEIQSTIRLYGEVLGKEDEAAKLIKDMDARLQGLKKPAKAPKALILYGAPGDFVVALPTSYPGNFLELAGGANVAAKFPNMDKMPQYAEFSMERIVAADPDVIYLITHGDPDEVKASFKKELQSNPVWKNLGAVKSDQFEVLPNDLFAANPGLRAPEAIEYLNGLLLQAK